MLLSHQQQQQQQPTTTTIVHAPQVTDVTTQDDKLYLKVFLLDDSINAAKWRIKSDSIPKHIEKFVGRPFILTKEHYHPLEFESVPIDYNNIPATVSKLLAAQEQYRIGTIKKVERSLNPSQAAYGPTWNAYVELTDPTVVNAARRGMLPKYVSASIFRLNQNECPQETTDYEPLHLASVDNPAYGIHKAGVRGACDGDLVKCSLQLAQASIYSSFVNSSTSEQAVNLTNDNAVQQQEQSNVVTPSQTGIPQTNQTSDNNNNNVAAPTTTTNPQSQPLSQPTQQPIQPNTTGNGQPFTKVEQSPLSTTQTSEKFPAPTTTAANNPNIVQDMAQLITDYKALLHEVNDLKAFKEASLKTEEENRTVTKRNKIESVIPAEYAGSPEERTKAIESLMKMPDGPELDYFLQKFVSPVTNPVNIEQQNKAIKQAAEEKGSFMRASKRVTDYASTTSANNQVKKPTTSATAVSQASTGGGETVDIAKIRRICSITDIVSNSAFEGGRF